MPWALTPMASPRTSGSWSRSSDRMRGPATAPSTPLTMVNTALSSGMPPTCCDMAIEIGVVADFGDIEATMTAVPPAQRVNSTAATIDATQPTETAPSTSNTDLRTRCHCRHNGSARATVAGPSRNAM